jgi:hypothetical protein
MRGEGGVAGSHPISTAVQYTGAINFGDLTPYLTSVRYSLLRGGREPVVTKFHKIYLFAHFSGGVSTGSDASGAELPLQVLHAQPQQVRRGHWNCLAELAQSAFDPHV